MVLGLDDTQVPYEDAPTTDLFVDALYVGSTERQQDALPRLLKVGVQGGSGRPQA